MKNTLLLTLLLSATALTAARAQTADETAIRQTIDGSLVAFDKRDLTAFAGFFVNSPDLYYQITPVTHEVILAHGWENMKKMVGGYMKNAPVTTPANHQMTDYKVRVKGDVATVTLGNTDGKENSREFMMLEKTGGTWKILVLTGQYYETGKLIVVK